MDSYCNFKRPIVLTVGRFPFRAFRGTAQNYGNENLYRNKKILNDLYTPVSAFLSLRDRYASVSVFESSTYHSNVNSKSFIGIDPIVTITVQNKELRSSINGESITDACADIETLEKHIDQFEFCNITSHSLNGFFGIFGHASVELFEDINVRASEDLPSVYLVIYRYVIVFYHYHNHLEIIQNSLSARIGRNHSWEQNLIDAVIIWANNRALLYFGWFRLPGYRSAACTSYRN